jgi:hypothetical protein
MTASTAQRFATITVAAMFVAAAYMGLVLPSVYTGVSIVGLLVCWLWQQVRLGVLRRPLSIVAVVVYTWPFLVFVRETTVSTDWGLTPAFRVLGNDTHLIPLAATVALIGLLGLVAGLGWDGGSLHRSPIVALRPMSSPVFGGLALVGVVLVALGSRSATIFDTPYAADGTSVAGAVGFSGAPLLGYSVLLLLLLGCSDLPPSPKRAKRTAIVLFSLVVAVGYLQLLRGNRNGIGVVAAAIVILATRARRDGMRVRVRPAHVVVAVLSLFAFSMVGSVRNVVYNTRSVPITSSITNEVFGGTAKAIAMTEVSAVYLYEREGPHALFFGSTYLDDVLSIPPQPIVDALGWQRPISSSSDRGPAWWGLDENLTLGGIHIVAVPLRNFGLFGVLVGMYLVGLIIRRCERWRVGRRIWQRLTYFTLMAISFYWFWYGDLYAVRALMAAGTIGMLYEMLGVSRGTKVPPRRTRDHLAPDEFVESAEIRAGFVENPRL